MAYNWRGNLGDYAQTSGVLAGFCFALIVFVLGWNVASTRICGALTYGEVSVLLIGIASVLFIASMEFFMTAKEFDLWSLPERWHKYIVNNMDRSEWSEKQKAGSEQCRNYEKLGRHSYNVAMLLVFSGFFFVIAPFNFAIAIVVSGLGLCLELMQFVKASRTSKQNEPGARSPKGKASVP
ncbi:MAG: hypothetical protein ACLP5V_03810 [Candidatus Bathyarchaeia archaeon]